MTINQMKNYMMQEYEDAQRRMIEASTKEANSTAYTERLVIGKFLVRMGFMNSDELQLFLDSINDKIECEKMGF